MLQSNWCQMLDHVIGQFVSDVRSIHRDKRFLDEGWFNLVTRVHTRGSTSNSRTFEGFFENIFENISMIKCLR